MDYETSKNVHVITQPQRTIGDIAISPDGHIVGFKYYDDVSIVKAYKEHLFVHVFNIDCLFIKVVDVYNLSSSLTHINDILAKLIGNDSQSWQITV